MAASLFRAPCMLRGGLVRAIPGIAADADTCLSPLQGNSRMARRTSRPPCHPDGWDM